MSSCQYQQLEQQEQDRFQTKGVHPQYHPHDSLDKIVTISVLTWTSVSQPVGRKPPFGGPPNFSHSPR